MAALVEFASQLETEQLLLRSVQSCDAAFLHEILASPQVRKYLGGPVAKAQHEARFQSYLRGARGIGIWVVVLKAENAPCGLIVLNPHREHDAYEISYEFHPSHWGKGYATQAVNKVVEHAFTDIKLTCIVAETQSANKASIRLLISLNFQEMKRLERFGEEQVIYINQQKTGAEITLAPV